MYYIIYNFCAVTLPRKRVQVIVLSTGTLNFIYLDEHARLVVSVSREHLGLLGRNISVTLDERSHHTSSSLDAERREASRSKRTRSSLRYHQ